MARVIHSDNQTTFNMAAKVFKASTQRMQLMKIDPNVVEDKLANQGVSWKFITERATHRGGHWETQRATRKVLRKTFLNYTEMMTVLTDIESHFWSRWLRKYLPSLTVHQKWTKEEIPLKQSDVVLISEDNIPRGKWKLRKIVDTFPG